MLRLSKVATPVVEVVTDVVPLRFPGPEAFVAVTVNSFEDSFEVVSELEYLSCKVTTGGGLKATAMNLSTVELVGT